MTQQITRAMLDRQIHILNLTMRTPTERKTPTNEMAIGHFYASGANGGWKLSRIDSIHGGARDVTNQGYMTRRELYYQVMTIINVLEYNRQNEVDP